MTKQELLDRLAKYFPQWFCTSSQFPSSEVGSIVIERLLRMESDPLPCTHLNQLLHMMHEVGMTDGFFTYYFHLGGSLAGTTLANGTGIKSLEQICSGLQRFFTDALLHFGGVRIAYEQLARMSYKELLDLFAARRFDPDGMGARGAVLPFHAIPADDRYLIAELACKAYSPMAEGTELFIESVLLKAYKDRGATRTKIKDLFDNESPLAKADPQTQMMLQFTTEEFAEETVSSQEEIREKVQMVAKRFVEARRRAVLNTRLYLSIVNELDVYVATSMRKRSDFREMSRDTARIFGQPALQRLRLRYFDPTISAAEGHEDKGLIECLMVKCAKALIYFAGE